MYLRETVLPRALGLSGMVVPGFGVAANGRRAELTETQIAKSASDRHQGTADASLPFD